MPFDGSQSGPEFAAKSGRRVARKRISLVQSLIISIGNFNEKCNLLKKYAFFVEIDQNPAKPEPKKD